ncbi:MAG: hypothetical protein RhofKO_27200 [Rhodothermales bacterium]
MNANHLRGWWGALSVALMLVSGCVPSRTIQQWTPPQTLNEVNAELLGKTERVYLVDGIMIRFAQDIEVRPDSIFWLDYNTEQRMSLPVDEVDYIRTIPRYRDDAVTWQRRIGIRLGAATALIMGMMRSAEQECQFGQCLVQWLGDTIVLMTSVAAAEAVARLAVLRPRFPREQIVYQRPVETYLQSDAAARRNP